MTRMHHKVLRFLWKHRRLRQGQTTRASRQRIHALTTSAIDREVFPMIFRIQARMTWEVEGW